MMEDISGQSCVPVYVAQIQVEYGTIGIKAPTWDKAMTQLEHFVDREDLYATFWALACMVEHAIKFEDRQALKKIIPKVHEVESLALGEWDVIFRTMMAGNETWALYKECERSIYSPSSSKEVPQHLQAPSQPVSRNQPSRGPSFSKTLAETAATAVVNDVVQDSVNAIFNAL